MCRPLVAFPTFADRARDFVVANLAWCAGPRLVVETVHSSLGKAVPPSADRVRADAKLRGDLFVLQAARRRQHNARPLGQCLRRPVLACQCRQLVPYNIVEFDRNSSAVCTENLIRVDDVMKSPKLAE